MGNEGNEKSHTISSFLLDKFIVFHSVLDYFFQLKIILFSAQTSVYPRTVKEIDYCT